LAARFSVLVTRAIPPKAIQRLRDAGCEVEVASAGEPLAYDRLLALVRGRQAVLFQPVDRIDAAVFDAAGPACRIFATPATGYDNVDLAAAGRRFFITNAPDALTETVADLTWALLLAAARRLGEAERVLRAGRWPGWRFDQFLGLEVHGTTLGVVGLGRIGRAVARRAAGFDMRVVAYTRTPPTDTGPAVELLPLDDLLTDADFITLHAPLTPQTHHLIGVEQLRRMKRSAVLINTSRGPLVDEPALAAALRDGTIAAAGLDVFEHEPRVHPGLLAQDNVVLLPHIGSASTRTRERMAMTAVENILAVRDGRRPAQVLSEPAAPQDSAGPPG